MAIRDYWVYQERQNDNQWALYIVKEYDRRHPSATVIDFTLYSEGIENNAHSVSKTGLHYDRVSGYVDEILAEICEFSTVTAEDKAQLEKAILAILND